MKRIEPPDISISVGNGNMMLNAGLFKGADDETRKRLDEIRKEFRQSSNLKVYDVKGNEWYKTAFSERFFFIYDKSFYDRFEKRYLIEELIDEGEKEFGGYDAVLIWHSFPRLGVDGRNQFDYYRDMPGGIKALRDITERAHKKGVKVFINYNPWDTATKREEITDAAAFSGLISETGADGIFLDTLSGIDPDFTDVIAKTNPAVVYDPELMPLINELANITGAWQQVSGDKELQEEPPFVPLVRWLLPEFSLRGIHRTQKSRKSLVKFNFFNGYGHVVWENIFGCWYPWNAEDRNLFKKCLSILRTYKGYFLDPDWQPFVSTLQDRVYAHEWTHKGNTAFTFINMNEKAVNGPIITVDPLNGKRCYDIWNGKSIDAIEKEGRSILTFTIAPQSVGFILITHESLPEPFIPEFFLSVDSESRKCITEDDLKPRSAGKSSLARKGGSMAGMVEIEGGSYEMSVRHTTETYLMCYGEPSAMTNKHPVQRFSLKSYYMDVFEVTNEQYKEFLAETKYRPDEMTNFLKHWEKTGDNIGQPWHWSVPAGKERHPVIWVDLDDARVFAKWAGKRLPTEEEWQYAAQGPHGRIWPWGDEYIPELCNGDSEDTVPVGSYPDSASFFGCQDMCGNVWEWTESERDDGHTRFAILKGGSHLKVTRSIWYTASGAQPCEVHEKILLMYPGLDRCGTVGFRCVKDII